jgi:hypothetical protein
MRKGEQKSNHKGVDLNLNMLTIRLKVNTPKKKTYLITKIFKMEIENYPNTCCLQKSSYLKDNDTGRFKIIEKIYNGNCNQINAEVPMLKSDTVGFRTKKRARCNEDVNLQPQHSDVEAGRV